MCNSRKLQEPTFKTSNIKHQGSSKNQAPTPINREHGSKEAPNTKHQRKNQDRIDNAGLNKTSITRTRRRTRTNGGCLLGGGEPLGGGGMEGLQEGRVDPELEKSL